MSLIYAVKRTINSVKQFMQFYEKFKNNANGKLQTFCDIMRTTTNTFFSISFGYVDLKIVKGFYIQAFNFSS